MRPKEKSEYERSSDRNLTILVVCLLAAGICVMITAVL